MNLQFGIREETYKSVRGYESCVDFPVSQFPGGIFPAIDKLFNQKHIELLTVKNQFAAFQVLLRANEEFSLSISNTAYFDKLGMASNIRLCVVINQEKDFLQSNMCIVDFVEDDDRMYKADILLSQTDIYVEKGLVQPVWVEIGIHKDAVPGQYTGRVEIFCHTGFEGEKKTGEVTFSIDVKDITLPDPKEYCFYLDLWQHNSNIARKHETPRWSDEHFHVIEKYILSLAAIGQKAISVVASEIPWSGQFCYRDSSYPSDLFEYSMIQVQKDINGKLQLDFSVMDRYIDLCFKYGIDMEIEVFGLLNIWMCESEGFGKVIQELSDGYRVRYLDLADQCFKYIDTVNDITTYIKEIEQHFICRGLMDKIRILADEPGELDIYNERIEFLRKIAPSFKFKAAVNHVEFIKQFSDKIEDFVPIFDAICKEQEHIAEVRKVLRGRLYWYVCCVTDIPNTFIRSNLLESYAIGWLTEYMKLDGFLRWNYTVWPEKPRERLSFRSILWKAGDMNFVYPSKNGAPLLTLRYKALQKGIQVFELLQMLKSSNPDAEDIIKKAYEKIFIFVALKEFHPDACARIEELISLEYKSYQEAIDMVIAGLLA